MLTFLAIVHVLIGFSLIFFVLLQDPKGGAMGVFSGGSSSNSFFGTSGASNFLTKATQWIAVLFAASCFGLSVYHARGGKSVMDDYVPPVSKPAAPSTPLEGSPSVPPNGAAPATPDTSVPAK
jgi:preprotein translocase subunit SecG